MRTIILFLFLASLTVSYAQDRKISVGFEYNTSEPFLEFQSGKVYADYSTADSNFVFGASIGTFTGNMMSFGLSAGAYARGGKKYQPGFVLDFDSFIRLSGLTTGTEFMRPIFIEDAALNGVPFSFSTKFANLIWIYRVGLELSVGYRYYLAHYQSPGINNFYRSEHAFEWGVGLKVRL